MQSITIASVRAHGVRQLLVYCRGKREGDWPCHHEAFNRRGVILDLIFFGSTGFDRSARCLVYPQIRRLGTTVGMSA
jgi:hypothetical protein